MTPEYAAYLRIRHLWWSQMAAAWSVAKSSAATKTESAEIARVLAAEEKG